MHNTDLKSGRHRQSLARRARAICSALLFGGGSVAPVPLFPIRNDDEKQPLSSLSPRSSMLAFVKCKAQNRKRDKCQIRLKQNGNKKSEGRFSVKTLHFPNLTLAFPFCSSFPYTSFTLASLIPFSVPQPAAFLFFLLPPSGAFPDL